MFPIPVFSFHLWVHQQFALLPSCHHSVLFTSLLEDEDIKSQPLSQLLANSHPISDPKSCRAPDSLKHFCSFYSLQCLLFSHTALRLDLKAIQLIFISILGLLSKWELQDPQGAILGSMLLQVEQGVRKVADWAHEAAVILTGISFGVCFHDKLR